MLDRSKICLGRALVPSARESGQTLTEYALLLLLIALAALGGAALYGVALNNWWNWIISRLPS